MGLQKACVEELGIREDSFWERQELWSFDKREEKYEAHEEQKKKPCEQDFGERVANKWQILEERHVEMAEEGSRE